MRTSLQAYLPAHRSKTNIHVKKLQAFYTHDFQHNALEIPLLQTGECFFSHKPALPTILQTSAQKLAWTRYHKLYKKST